jgi:hypothetical protein
MTVRMKISSIKYPSQFIVVGLMALATSALAKPTFGPGEILLKCTYRWLPNPSTRERTTTILLNTKSRSVYWHGTGYHTHKGRSSQNNALITYVKEWNESEVIFQKQATPKLSSGWIEETRIDRKTGKFTAWDNMVEGKRRETYDGQCSRLEEGEMLF